MMDVNWIALILTNFGLFLLGVAIVFILVHLVFKRKTTSKYDVIYRWIALFPLGLTALYAFVMHAFFAEYTAATIGWQNTPFQYEVAVANLGFGFIGILSFYNNFGFRLATVLANTCWLWGDAVIHAYQMVVHQNFTVGNAGSWLWMDILIPLILLICIIKLRNHGSKNAT